MRLPTPPPGSFVSALKRTSSRMCGSSAPAGKGSEQGSLRLAHVWNESFNSLHPLLQTIRRRNPSMPAGFSLNKLRGFESPWGVVFPGPRGQCCWNASLGAPNAGSTWLLPVPVRSARVKFLREQSKEIWGDQGALFVAFLFVSNHHLYKRDDKSKLTPPVPIFFFPGVAFQEQPHGHLYWINCTWFHLIKEKMSLFKKRYSNQ